MKTRYLSTGNEACAEGAIRAGCQFYAGYPITPQNEITAYMSRRMEETGWTFIQSESELSAISMVFGASVAGARAMTSSSSPGISLKQEGISYLAGCELPGVIINVMRGGPGLGNISTAQSDYFQATKGGGHGDYHSIVYAPASVQEMFDFTYKAFAKADEYRTPVMILADGTLGQMMEPVEFDDDIEPSGRVTKPWAMTGAKGRKANSVKSLLLGDGVLERHNEKLQEKYNEIEEKEVMYHDHDTDDADIVMVAYGTTGRIAYSCMNKLREEGVKIGLFRPQTLWPFPYKEISHLAAQGTKFLVIEMSSGQMLQDVRMAVQDDKRISFWGRLGGGIPTEEEIIETVKKM